MKCESGESEREEREEKEKEREREREKEKEKEKKGNVGIGPRGYARRNLGLHTSLPMSATYRPHITPPKAVAPTFRTRFWGLG